MSMPHPSDIIFRSSSVQMFHVFSASRISISLMFYNDLANVIANACKMSYIAPIERSAKLREYQKGVMCENKWFCFSGKKQVTLFSMLMN